MPELVKFARAQAHPELLVLSQDPEQVYLNDAATTLFANPQELSDFRDFLARVLPNLLFEADENVLFAWREQLFSFSCLGTTENRFPIRITPAHNNSSERLTALTTLEKAHWNSLRLETATHLLAHLASPALYRQLNEATGVLTRQQRGQPPSETGTSRHGTETLVLGQRQNGTPINYHIDNINSFLTTWITRISSAKNSPELSFQCEFLPTVDRVPMFCSTLDSILSLVFSSIASIPVPTMHLVVATESNRETRVRLTIRLRKVPLSKLTSTRFFWAVAHPSDSSSAMNWPRLESLMRALGHELDLRESGADTEISLLFSRFPATPPDSIEQMGRLISEMPTSVTPADDSLPEIPGLLVEVLSQPGNNEGPSLLGWAQSTALDTFVVLVADVSAYAIEASILKTLLMRRFKEHARNTTDPGQVLRALNSEILRLVPATGPDLATATVVSVTPGNRAILSACAGTPPVKIARARQLISPLASAPSGPPLGIEANPSFHTATIVLEKGDHLVVMSDPIRDELFMRAEGCPSLASIGLIGQKQDAGRETRGPADEVTRWSGRQGICLTMTFDQAAEHSFRIPSAVDFIPQATSRLLRGADQVGLTGDQMYQVKLAVHEAVVNAIEHGNNRNRDKRVTIEYRASDNGFTIRVSDEGPGFSPSGIPDPTDPDNVWREGGRGLFLIRSMMDEVHHENGGRTIVMTKRRKSHPA